LRRGLAQLGQLGIRQTSVELIEEIAGAAANLSRRKIGALIVIEREAGLKSYIESGTPIDAKVTNYLLTSIFIPQSPLHDGAVIIQQGRLIAAGCVLPLPEEERMFPKSLGMRHRAAVGISEETDAVCVVVSEETGAVSVAHAGKLTHGLDEETLVRTLKNLFYRAEKKKTAFNIKTAFRKQDKNKNR
jgi:diadenylate cyclase